MTMSLTWIAIIASLLMGIGAFLIFVLAVKKDYFHNLEDTKYQVFWSDVEELVETVHQPIHDFDSPTSAALNRPAQGNARGVLNDSEEGR